MHGDEGMADGDQGQISEKEQNKQRAGQRRKTEMTAGEKRQKRIKHRIFLFSLSNLNRETATGEAGDE